jgi:hypothetical protein
MVSRSSPLNYSTDTLSPELPDKAHLDDSAELEASNAESNASTSAPAPGTSTGPAPQSSAPAPLQFPGGGNTLGVPPSSAPGRAPARSPAAPPQQQPQFPDSDIETLSGFGASRAEAIQLLQESGGNLEIAASMWFSRQ